MTGNAPEKPDGSDDRWGRLEPEELDAIYEKGREEYGAAHPGEDYSIRDCRVAGLRNVYVKARMAACKAILAGQQETEDRTARERDEARAERDAARQVLAQVGEERDAARVEAAEERGEATILRGYLERANRELGEVAKALGCDPKDTPLGLGAVAEAAKKMRAALERIGELMSEDDKMLRHLKPTARLDERALIAAVLMAREALK